MIGAALTVALVLPVQVDRLDLGIRLQSFETAYLRAVERKELDNAAITAIDRAFDRLSVQFFAGNGGGAISELDRLTRPLTDRETSAAGDSVEPKIATSIEVASPVVLDGPVVLWPEQSSELRYRIQSAEEYEGDDPLTLSLALTLVERVERNPERTANQAGPSSEHRPYRGASGHAEITLIPLENAEAWVDLRWDHPASAADCGEWTLYFGECPSGPASDQRASGRPTAIALARVHFLAEDPDLSSATLLARAAKLAETTDLADDISRAISIFRDRCGKLKSKWNGTDTFPVADDLEALRQNLNEEIVALESGKNPYRSKSGTLWKTLRVGDSKAIPYRVSAPSAVRERGKLPLVIAFHGMGGDENMFFSAYGAGRLKDLAESKGILCVTPLTYDFLGKPDRVDALIQEIERDYEVDRERIHVLGHSMGAGVALSIAQKRGDWIASAAAFAGAGNRNQPIVPTILFAGTNDGIVPYGGVEKFANAPKVKDSIEFRPLRGRGHTLLVGDHLEEAIDFLLAHPKKKP